MSSFDEIADSTDWLPTTLSGFAAVESALRCQVCKDFFQTPVITSCAHTFCSLCIRKCLSSDGRCPTCRASDQDSKLRRNWCVEEVVEAFKNTRGIALELARKDSAQREKEEEQQEEEEEREGTAKGKRRSKRAGLKRKIEDTDIDEEDNEDHSSQVRKTRSQSRRQAADDTPEQPEVIDVEDDEKDEEYVDEQPEDGLVRCPICNKKMKEQAVFLHLDQCSGEAQAPSGKAPPSRLPAVHPLQKRMQPQQPSTTSRLPQLNYSLLNEKDLRKKLASLGIPTWGARQLLVRRHTEWVSIYNSNCDSSRPRSKRELLKELDTWERSQGGHASTAPSAIMKKDFDGQRWAESNKDQFAELIANARKNRAKPINSTLEKGEGSGTPVENGDSSVQLPSSFSTINQDSTSSEEKNNQDLSMPDATPPNEGVSALPLHMSATPSRKLPMFQLPEQPLRDLDGGSTL